MYKRPRIDEASEPNETMDVEVYNGKNNEPDILERLGGSDKKILQLLQEIMPSNDGIELVENSSQPLGVSPVGDHRKKINGQEIVELAAGIALADNGVKWKITHKLEMVSEQIQFLRQQAMRVIKDGQESLSLNHIACNFRKVPGNTYYVYKRPTGQAYFSVLSPLDWDGNPPHVYCGAYVYGHDLTWSRVHENCKYLTS